jgi:hypothetical protein
VLKIVKNFKGPQLENKYPVLWKGSKENSQKFGKPNQKGLYFLQN